MSACHYSQPPPGAADPDAGNGDVSTPNNAISFPHFLCLCSRIRGMGSGHHSLGVPRHWLSASGMGDGGSHMQGDFCLFVLDGPLHMEPTPASDCLILVGTKWHTTRKQRLRRNAQLSLRKSRPLALHRLKGIALWVPGASHSLPYPPPACLSILLALIPRGEGF